MPIDEYCHFPFPPRNIQITPPALCSLTCSCMLSLCLSLSTLQLVDGQEEDIWRRRGRRPGWANHRPPSVWTFFARGHRGRKKGEMYGTRMLVVCGHGRQLCWRFVVLNRGTRARGLRTWAALDSRRNSSHSGASQEPQNERKLAIRIA